MMNLSPLLPYQTGQHAFMLVAAQVRPVQYQIIKVTNGRAVSSIEEAEDMIFAEAFKGDAGNDLLVALIREADNIARRSTRATANRLFAHPDTIKRLPVVMVENPARLGRWLEVGVLELNRGRLRSFTSTHMPENEIVIAFRADQNQLDGAAIVLADAEGHLRVMSDPHTEKHLHRPSAYVTKLVVN